MALDNFRTIELIWDKANKSIIKTIKTASSDTTGRYLSVKILDGGQEVTLNNAKLQLYWEHPNFNTSGTDDFETMNNGGLFKMTFSDEMLTNIGELNAHLVLTLSDGKITSGGFPIEVFKGADDGVVVPTNGAGLVKQIDGKIDKGNVTLTDLTQEVKLAMTGGTVAVVGENAVGTENVKNGTVTTEKIAYGAVTPDVTTFAKKGKNLFNGIFSNVRVTGGVGNGTFMNESGIGSIISVQPNTAYRISFDVNSKNDVMKIAASSSYPNHGDTVRVIYNSGSSINSVGIMTGDNEHYLISYFATPENGNTPINLQIEQNIYHTEYESPTKVSFDFVDKSIEFDAIKPRYGILNGYSNKFRINFSNRTIVMDGARVQIGNERVELPSQVYTIEALNNFAQTVILTPDLDLGLVDPRALNKPENKDLIILGYLIWDTKEHYLFGNYTVEDERNDTGNETTTPNDRIFIADKVSGNYTANVPDFNVYNRSIDTLYGIYDDLVDEFPEYVSRTHLADDAGGVPIYRYDFNPQELSSGEEAPVKIIATCTHAHEVHATYGLAYYFDDLARNWKEKDVLRMLRWNVHFIVVPNQNPWGFNEGSRVNFNGVDVNRNYSAGWSSNYTNENYDYPGVEPMSEINNQVMAQLLEDNKDAVFVLDNHNYLGDPYQGSTVLYIASDTKLSQEIGEQHVRSMVAKSKQDGYVPIESKAGRIYKYNKFGGSFAKYVDSIGLTGFLLENMSNLNNSVNTEAPDSGLFRFNIESPGNALLTAFNYFTR